MKKIILVIIAVALAPVLLMSMVALAAGDWNPVGQTGAGDKISLSSVRVLAHSQRMAWVRVEYNEPARLPQGGPFVEMRARVRFNCGNGTAVPTAEWFYSRDRGGRPVVSKKAKHDDQFGKASEGGFGELASNYVCSQK